jgi:tRNA(Ile)-lysidine synthase
LGYNLIIVLENLKQILQDECQLNINHPVIVGVSGGPDSLCLLDVLDRMGYAVIIAHFNHKLRSSADREAEVIRQIATERGLNFFLGEGEVSERVTREGESVEEAARNARYQFLFACAERAGAQGVAVGHSADDQVETVLMHLLRGAGMSGLRGMSTRARPNAWSEQIPLVRPLLSIWRSEILEYCNQRGLDPISDSSNEDIIYFRNRLRHELIPYLETYNPAVRKLIWRTAEVMRGEMDLVDQLVAAAWKDCFLSQGEGFIAIDSLSCSQRPLSVQRHIIRRAIAELRPGLRDIGFNAIEMSLKTLQSSKPYGEIDLISGLKLVHEPGRIWIADWETEIPTGDWPQMAEEPSCLDIGGNVELRAGWQLSAERGPTKIKARDLSWEGMDAYQVWVDQGQLNLPLIVRTRKEGDRLQPYGMEGHSLKVSDLMINEKLPRRARERWPLVCSGEHIVWVVGYRLAHPFRVTQSTIEVVSLKLTRPEPGKGIK